MNKNAPAFSCSGVWVFVCLCILIFSVCGENESYIQIYTYNFFSIPVAFFHAAMHFPMVNRNPVVLHHAYAIILNDFK